MGDVPTSPEPIKPKKRISWESKTTRYLITAVSVVVITLALIFGYILNPSISPIASIHDADGDGYADNVDAFLNDPNEWKDTDGDGVGDNSDYYPNDSTRGVQEYVIITLYKATSGDGVFWTLTVASVSDRAPTSDFYVKIVNTTGDLVVYKQLSTYTSGTAVAGVTWNKLVSDSTLNSGDYFKLVKATYPNGSVFTLIFHDYIAAQIIL